MILEIFEVRSDEETDALILKLHKKFPGLQIRKTSVLDAEKMKDEQQIKEIMKQGIDSLPLFRVDGKIVAKQQLEELLYQ